MIIDAEISKSGKAKCAGCKSLIPEGSVRGVEEVKQQRFTSKRYYCKTCTKKRINHIDKIHISSWNKIIDLEKNVNK